MKKLFLISLPIVLLIAMFYGCNSTLKNSKESNSKNTTSSELIVYGSTTCSHCTIFTNKLDSAGIEYDFRNVDENDDYYLEVQKKVKAAKYTSGRYPVLDINGKIYVSASFNKLDSLLSLE